ncbi:MAG TPA: hypothetical protein VGR07_18430, partial [Thermoanaerobaculia bacterium]|nr:hypothetical protein [Thermoanaerobaculia bacterium]
MTLRFSLFLFAVLTVLTGLSRPAHAQGDPAADPLLWPEPQRAFYQDGPGLLLSAEDRQRFLAADEAGKDAFIRKLQGSELLRGIERRQQLARTEYLSPRDVRAQLLFLNGPPAERKAIDCGTAFRPMEIWTYSNAGASGPTAKLDPKTGKPEGKLSRAVVYQAAPDEPFRYWSPIDSKRSLYTPRMAAWLEDWEEIAASYPVKRFDLQVCKQAELVDQATGVPGLTGGARSRRQKKQIAAVFASGYGIRPWTSAEGKEGFLDPPGNLALWAREAAATALPKAAPAALTISPVDVQFPEKSGQRMIAQALVRVTPDEHVKITQEEGKPHVGFIVEGVLEHEGKVFDEFRVRYHLPVQAAQKEPIDLSVDRELRPDQSFLLRLKVRDEATGAEAVTAKGFRVPREPVTPALPPPSARAAAPGKKGEVLGPAVASGPDSLTLFPPESDVIVGVYRAEAIVTGRRIAKVTFFVDGQRQLTRNGPPYSTELRLAQFPTEQLVRAEGYDEAGKLVAADEVVVNEPRGIFKVSILSPPRGAKVKEDRAEAKAEV